MFAPNVLRRKKNSLRNSQRRSRPHLETLEQRVLLAVTAVDDFYSTGEVTEVVVSAPGFLFNDIGVNAGATILTVDFDTSGTVGLAVPQLDGSFTYDPDGQFDSLNTGQIATDSFTYGILALEEPPVDVIRFGQTGALETFNAYYLEEDLGADQWDTHRAAAAASEFGGVDGHLLTINSSDEQELIEDLGGNYWLGLTDSTRVSTIDNFDYSSLGTSENNGSGDDFTGWRWITGEPFGPSTYSNWNSGEPNNSGDAVRMISNDRWGDENAGDTVCDPGAAAGTPGQCEPGSATAEAVYEYDLGVPDLDSYVENGFTVRQVDANGQLTNLADANAALGGSFSEETYAFYSKINISNSGGSFLQPQLTGADTAFQMNGHVYIPAPGEYTFAVNSEDGFELSIDGTFLQSATNDQGSTLGPNGSLAFDGTRGSGSPTLGVFEFPSAGFYEVDVTYFNSGNSQQISLFAAEGAQTSFSNPTNPFLLVNDIDGGGLAVVSNVLPQATATVTITIVGQDDPPEVSFITPLNGASVEAGTTENVIVSATVEQGLTVTQVQLLADGNLVGSDATAPYEFQLSVPPDLGDLILQAIATDNNGNQGSALITVEVVDTTAPVIIVPTDRTIEFGDNEFPPATGTATALDNSDPMPDIAFFDTQTPGNCAGEFTIERTWTATDESGNTGQGVQIIQVVDTTPPELFVPADTTVPFGGSTDPSNTGMATATDLTNIVTVTFTDSSVPGTGMIDEIITRKWTATDDCGNLSAGEQTITVEAQDLPPTVTIISPTGNVEAGTTITVQVDATDDFSTPSVSLTADGNSIGTDPSPPYTFQVNVPPTPGASLTLVATATDSVPQTAMDTVVLSIVDTTPPVIVAPPTTTIELGEDDSPSNTGTATATDNIDPSPTITSSDVVIPGDCIGESTIERTWTATDDSGNQSSAVQLINIVDTTPPTLTVPGDVSVDFGDSTDPADTGMATATDLSNSATVSFNDTEVPGSGTIDRIITRTWTATDDCGNSVSDTQTITVGAQDFPPTVTIISPTGNVAAGTTITVQVNATDDFSTPSVGLTVDGNSAGTDNSPPYEFQVSVPATPGQTLTLVATATDSLSQTDTDTVVLSIVDTIPPVLTLPPDITVEFGDPEVPPDTGTATATDNIDPSPTVTFSDNLIPGTCAGNYVIQRTWTATDASGNSVSDIQIVTVEDTIPPVLTVPADITVLETDDTSPANTGTATATDLSTPIDISFSDTTAPGVFPILDVITRTWIATDDCGNSSSGTQTISVESVNRAPEPADAIVSVDENSPNGTLVYTVDPNDPNAPDTHTFSITSGNGAGVFDIDANGQITVVDNANLDFETNPQFVLEVTVTDNSGLSGTATITVNVNDLNDPPVANDDQYATDEDTFFSSTVSLLDNDTDEDGTLTIASAPVFSASGAFISVNSTTGQFVYDPSVSAILQALPEGAQTTDIFTYTVTDGTATDTATVTITVDGLNDAPTATDDTFFIPPTPGSDTFDVLANDFDIDMGDTLTLTSVTASTPFGSAVISGNQLLIDFDSLGGQGVAEFQYTVSDAEGATDMATVTVLVSDGPCAVTNGHLLCIGTPASDRMIAEPAFGGIQVRYNFELFGPFSGVNTIEFLGLAGNDELITRANPPVTFDGGPGNDYLAGSTTDDIMIGSGGNDRILAGEGDNIIYGDDPGALFVGGNDDAQGRSGDDIILGGPGNDRLQGQSGNDILSGGSGRDEIFGGLDDDFSFDSGFGDFDTIRDEGGNDVVFGGGGSDRISGGIGDDLLIGGIGGEEWIRGDDGDDALINGGSSLESQFDQALEDLAAGNDALFNALILPGLNAWRTSRTINFGLIFDDNEVDLLDGMLGNDRLDAEDGIDILNNFDPSSDTRI